MELQRLKPCETVATLKPKAQARMQELTADLSRVIELPEGESARVGDLLAANAYRKLQK